MKKTITLFLFMPAFLFGQQVSELSLWNLDSTAKKNVLFLGGNGSIASNGLRSNLYNKFIWGGNISQDLKNATLFDLEKNNRSGIHAVADLGLISDLPDYFGHGVSSIVVLKQTLFFDSELTAPIPDMILSGNAKYLGRTIPLQNNYIQSLSYASISFGLLKTIKTENETYRFGAMLGYAMGLSHQSLKIYSGTLSFADEGSAIDLNGIYQISMSDTSNSRWLNGNGITGSFFFQYLKDHKYAISFTVEDAGFILWNEKAMSQHKKTDIHFEGFQLSDIIHFTGNEITNTADSLFNTLYYPEKSGSYTSKTPCKITLDGKVKISKYLTLSGTIGQTVYSMQKPHAILKPVITNLIPTIDLAAYLISNGYSPYDLGVEITVKTIKNMRIKTSIFSIPLNSHTLGGELRVGYRF